MQQLQTVDAKSAYNVNKNQPINQPFKYSSPPVTRHHGVNSISEPLSTTYLGWHASLRDLVPDPKDLHVVIVMAGFMDENGHVKDRCHRQLASDCGISISTLRRRLDKLSECGAITIHLRRVARDFNDPNTYIINIHAWFRGGGAQNSTGDAPTAEYIKHPAGACVESPPLPTKPAPAKPRTRHIIASSRIANQFCTDWNIPRTRHYERMRLTQRIQDRLDAGDDREAIRADLDREYRARSSPVEPHRNVWRSRRRAEEDRMARDLYTQSGRQHTPEEWAELEAREREAQAHEAAGDRWSNMRNGWVKA